jgi:hypothetical protein
VRILDLFLLEGAQVIVDLCIAMLQKQYPILVLMEELELMDYLKRDIIIDVFQKWDFKDLLGESPIVKLS